MQRKSNRGLFTLALSVCALAIGMLSILPSTRAKAQNWPERNVRLILPFGAGSATDIAARLRGREQGARGADGHIDRAPAGRQQVQGPPGRRRPDLGVHPALLPGADRGLDQAGPVARRRGEGQGNA